MIGVGTVDFGEKEKSYVNKVLDSGLITAGPMLDRFEDEFASRHGCKYGLMLNSGTDALRVAVAALKEKYGWSWEDQIIVPALTFVASSNVILQNELTPHFVDVDPKTFLIDPQKIEEAIDPVCTKAIMVVHLFGLPCDMGPIMALAKRYGLKVIEDSCESMGVTYRGKPVGSFGDVACFSTYAAHLITTGVGGLAITNEPDLNRLMKSFANHGRDPIFMGFRDSSMVSARREASQEVIKKRFKFDRIGYSSRSTQLEAALGLAQLERLDEIIFQRSNHFTFLASQLHGVEGIQIQDIPEDREHAGMMFPILLTDNYIDRDAAMLYLERRGIETRPFFDVIGQPAYKDINFYVKDVPVSERLSARGFYVGCHQSLSTADLWQIVEVVKDCIRFKARVSA